MSKLRLPLALVALSACAAAVLTSPLGAQAAPRTTVDAFLSPPSPLEISTARKADKIAWVTYERGLRNVYVASAPEYKAVKITQFNNDDGIDIGGVSLSDDGTIATFIRGSSQNRVGWVANPSHDPAGADRALWAARTDGTGAWRLASIANDTVIPGAGGRGGGGGSPKLSPDGRYVVYGKNGQLYRARTTRVAPITSIDTGGVPFVKAWGRQGSPEWSPDGSKLAFVTTRDNHSFVAVYDMKTRKVSYIAPSVDFDGSPTWSADGKRIAFTRRPGTPFGQQAQQGQGGIGNPAGPALQGRGGGRAGGAPGGGRGGRGGFGGGGDDTPARIDGLYRAAFPGGYTLSIMVADVATGTAQELWHAQPNDRVFSNINSITWAGDNIVFGAQVPNDEWDRYYSISVTNPQRDPVLLTTTDGLINDGVADRTFTTIAFSRDGKTLFYCTNAQDIEGRNIWAVPTSGGTPVRISTGEGIEVSPTPLSSGKQVAVLYFGASQPASVGLVPVNGGDTKVIYPTAAMLKDFPKGAHVEPQVVKTKAPDGLEVSNQLFLPKDLKPGERRPAIVFVHGGPQRQMLPAYHYMQFYHWAYAYNQYLASQGYVVLSVNYRSGIGYGRSFRQAPNLQSRGNSEYQDVLAGGKYLQSRPDVDPARVGIWGLSYGGLLTAQALARNSDVFVAGVDLAGVHLYGSSLDSTDIAFQSAAASHIDTWKSPVYLVHGDDDRNVDFSQTIGLVSLLRAFGVYHELTVIPDDVHESLIHRNWIEIFNHSSDFLHRFVWEKQTPPAVANQPK